jgi:arginyl-tRNA--protein-N-Asp/Glu arginylyltransferase
MYQLCVEHNNRIRGERGERMGLAYVYLGYWVPGSRKMDYKGRFLPQERLLPSGWSRVEK